MALTFSILVTDNISGSGLQPLREDSQFELVEINDSSSTDFRNALTSADGLIVRSATKVDSDMLAEAQSLKVIGRAGVGVDNIDLDAATERGIAVLNAPAGNTVSAAELTLALMLSVVRRVPGADASVRRGEWDRGRFKGAELRGRTLGLVGAGRVGQEVAQRCRAFGMQVVVSDPYLTDARAKELGLDRADLGTVIESADVLSLHVPLTDDTRGMIDQKIISRMKKSAFIVNVSRGQVIDEAALAVALNEERIAGAALDVYENEPLEDDSPLRKAPGVVLTPHLGASTLEAQELVATEISGAVKAALLEGDLSHALNASVRMLERIPDLTVEEIPSGCCGMAGAFGYQAEHYDVSMAMAELDLLPAVRVTDETTEIVASGTSCRAQIRDGTGRTALHPAVLLQRALTEPGD